LEHLACQEPELANSAKNPRVLLSLFSLAVTTIGEVYPDTLARPVDFIILA
jgi:hypothetical protein